MINMKEQNFGLELEFTNLSRDDAARAIAQVINGNTFFTKERSYDKRIVTGADGRKWQVMSDASVRGSHSNRGGEFVTPICKYEDMSTVQECIRALRRAGAKVDYTCGIHVHVDGANHNARSLKNLAFMFRSKEDMIYKGVGAEDRKHNQYCKPIDDELVENIRKIKKLDMHTLADVWYKTYAPYESRAQHYNSSRYHGLNLHSIWYRGTVEFRLFHSTLHAGKVRAYICLCLAMSAYAINAKRMNVTTEYKRDDKHQMGCFLWNLGFQGDEWKVVRQHLLAGFNNNAERQAA
jgi:hypothetical protein